MLTYLDRALRWSTGLMAAMALFSIMLLTLVDVTGRKFYNHSVPGGLEVLIPIVYVPLACAAHLVYLARRPLFSRRATAHSA